LPLDPIQALFWSAVINGVAGVPIMVMLMLMGSRRRVMGQFTLTPWLMTLGWLASAVTSDIASDGTTTATVLAQAVVPTTAWCHVTLKVLDSRCRSIVSGFAVGTVH
jgi:hypothetical protein